MIVLKPSKDMFSFNYEQNNKNNNKMVKKKIIPLILKDDVTKLVHLTLVTWARLVQMLVWRYP
jgi:hypothetical protein